jgi:hypothetical protein
MGFTREKRNGAAREERNSGGREERSERRSSRRDEGRSSSRSSTRGNGEYAFTNIGSVKQGRNMTDKDAAELKGCGESIKLQLYMPAVNQVVLSKDAVMGIKLGRRSDDKNFVLGQAYLPMGSLTPTKKTNDDLADFLGEFSKIEDFDLIAQIYLPKDVKTVTLNNGATLLLTFKTGDKAEDLKFVLGTLALANDSSNED